MRRINLSNEVRGDITTTNPLFSGELAALCLIEFEVDVCDLNRLEFLYLPTHAYIITGKIADGDNTPDAVDIEQQIQKSEFLVILIGPSPNEIAKDFLVEGGKTIGYITGTSAFSAMGLTTQITSSLLIGTSKYRRPVKRGRTVISFLVQSNPVTEENIPLLRILDAIKLIREIPATTPDEAVSQIGRIIGGLSPSEQKNLVSLSIGYTPYVRAILGAILEHNAADADIMSQVRKSLNGTTNYKQPISESVLPTKRNWNII